MRRTFWVAATCALAIGFAAVVSGCGSGAVNGNFTYNTTSTASSVVRGAKANRSGGTNFGTWTFVDGDLTATLVRTDGGTAQYTLTVNATCAAPSTDFGFQLCTISGGACTAGAVACPSDAVPTAGDTFFLKTVEGIALFALTGNELHAGVVQGSCDANIAGDYVFTHMGVGSRDLLGMYQLDATFTNIVHADFGMRSKNATSPFEKEVVYTTDDPNGQLTLSGATCTNGVWSIPEPGGGGGTLYATLTQSGLFLLNKSDDGGILSFKMASKCRTTNRRAPLRFNSARRPRTTSRRRERRERFPAAR